MLLRSRGDPFRSTFAASHGGEEGPNVPGLGDQGTSRRRGRWRILARESHDPMEDG